MAMRPALNARQRMILARIADGTEPVSRADSALVTTVNALSNRKLVIKRPGPRGVWTAEATDLGRALLEPQPKAPTKKPPTVKLPKVVTRGGLPIVEAVELPKQWPAILRPTLQAMQGPFAPGQRRRVVRGVDHVIVNVNTDLLTRAQQVLWLFAQNLSARQVPWVRIKPVPRRLNQVEPDEGHRLGTLALGRVEAPMFVSLLEVGWWRPEPAGRVGISIGNRTWSERRLADGRHCIDLPGALGDIAEMVVKGEIQTARQQEAEARDRELDARYAVERERALRDAALDWQVRNVTERGLVDAESWERADRLHRFAQAIRERHPRSERWQAYSDTLSVRAYVLDPLTGDPPVVMAPVPAEHLYRMSVRWPEKRPQYWEPTPDRPRRRRRY